MSGKRKVKVETEVLGSGSIGKRLKLPVQDPFADRYAEVSVELHNLNLQDICAKLFDKTENSFKYEIKSYKSEFSGYSKTVCGETLFIEESKTVVVITYQKDKKEDMTELLLKRFPSCVYSFK